MNILVTGGAGYIGSHTAKLLAARGHQPVVFDDLTQGHEWAVKWGAGERGPLVDAAGLRNVFERHRIDAVVHFAANALVGESMTNPSKYFHNNTVGTLTLLDAMRAAGVGTIVFSSTCATYGDPIRVPIDEAHPQAPVNPYGESKLMVEKLLLWYGVVHGLQWIALRYFNAAGADPDGEIGEDHDPESHLIPLVIGATMGTRPAGHGVPGAITRHRTARQSATTCTSPTWRTRTCGPSSASEAARRARRSNLEHRSGPIGARRHRDRASGEREARAVHGGGPSRR